MQLFVLQDDLHFHYSWSLFLRNLNSCKGHDLHHRWCKLLGNLCIKLWYALGSINRVHLTCSLVYTSICHSLRLMAVLMLILTVISLCILLLYLVHTFVQGVSCSCLKWTMEKKKKKFYGYIILIINKSPANLDKLDLCRGGGGFLTSSFW